MTIQTFLRDQVFLPRLNKASVLVVYDPGRRYYQVCRAMGGGAVRFVDAGAGSLVARAEAMAALRAIGAADSNVAFLLIHVQAGAPREPEDKQRDPFSLFGACGAVFPEGDGDEYQSLCLKYKPDHATEIRKIFAEIKDPSFEMIDAVGGGAGWPQLETLLNCKSAIEILAAMIAPNPQQQASLESGLGWASEARSLFASALGLTLKTQTADLKSITGELARFALFSEFVFDLPATLPAALADVPRAREEARPVIEALCDRLRDSSATQEEYIQRAEGIERALSLPEHCRHIPDLGQRDTFPFEERSFFTQGKAALLRRNEDALRSVLERHTRSIWARRGENQAQWALLEAAAALVQACEDLARELPEHAKPQSDLIDFYVTRLREADRLHREFEQEAAGSALLDGFDGEDGLRSIVDLARDAHRKIVNTAQTAFLKSLEREGWPPAGRLANVDVFERRIAPGLSQSGRRVAVFMIDALRYELGVELRNQLAAVGQAELQPAFAPLPSVTPVGMAALLPDAGRTLRLARVDDKIAPRLGDKPVETVAQRMQTLRERYGTRFHEMPLREFATSQTKPGADADLLVLRSNDMDSAFENNADSAPSLIANTLRQIVAAANRLAKLGFDAAVIVTDHGFHLNTALGPGDKCQKPAGNWVNAHNRMLLGAGSEDGANVVFKAEALGIRGDFPQAALPRMMIAYDGGATYFHGGASLQESIVPVIEIALRKPTVEATAAPLVTLAYKRGGGAITSRRPVFELRAEAGLFPTGETISVLVQAQDDKGKVVGEASPGKNIDATTRVALIEPGESLNVLLIMQEDFEGKFTVKALDPNTLTTYSAVTLKTDYTV